MLIIDADLHNPKLNGKKFIINGKINPEFALSQDNIVAGNGILITKSSNGSLKISRTSGSSDDVFLMSKKIDCNFLQAPPDLSYFIIFVKKTGISELYSVYNKYVLFEKEEFFGDISVEESNSDSISLGFVLTSTTSSHGRGLLISCQNQDRMFAKVIATWDNDGSIVRKESFGPFYSGNDLFLGLSDVYYNCLMNFEINVFNEITFKKYATVFGTANFIYGE